MYVQREQNRIMSFKSFSLQMVHVNAVPVGRICHSLQAEAQSAVHTSQQSSDSLSGCCSWPEIAWLIVEPSQSPSDNKAFSSLVATDGGTWSMSLQVFVEASRSL